MLKSYLFAALCLLWNHTSANAQTGISIPNPSRILQQSGASATGKSRAFNPAISVNGLFLGTYASDPFSIESAFGHDHDAGDEGAEDPSHEAHAHGLPATTGLTVQEVEVRLTSAVDAHLKADLILAIPGTEGIEIEEGIVTAHGLPNVTLKAGKFYAAFGKHNGLHTHAFPFVDPPLFQERILGGEGLNEVGVSASFLLPADWFSEWTLEILNGDNALFSSPKGEDLAYATRLRNLFDLGPSTTLDIGLSYATGQNEHSAWTRLLGSDLTIKWRPTRRGVYRSATFQLEYAMARVTDDIDTEQAGGLSTHLQLQVAHRWYVQGRYDLFGLPRSEPDRQHRLSGLLAFAPSEFSALRLQYSVNREADETVHQLGLQLNFTMGAHPAHSY